MLDNNCRKLIKNVIIFLGIIFSLGISVLPFKAYAATADTINLQGKIVRNDSGYEGLNVATGTPSCVVAGSANDTCDFRVRYYSASSAGTLFLTETFLNKEIGQYNGAFNLSLGSGTPTSGTYTSLKAMILGESSVYVEIGFDPAGGASYTETFARMPLQATAYALAASGAYTAFQFDTATSSAGYTASTGMVYFDTTDNVLKVYDGSVWAPIGSGSGLWEEATISGTYSTYLAGIAAMDTFTLDTAAERATISGSQANSGLTVYSSYNSTGGWPVVSFKADGSAFNGSVLELVQDGTGDILSMYTGSTEAFAFEAEQTIYIVNRGSQPTVYSDRLYNVGHVLYWNGEAVLTSSAGAFLWTDAGTYTYLTSTTDDVAIGGNSAASAKFYFDVTNGRFGIGTGTPQAALDIAGADAEIFNDTGDITISPDDTLVVKANDTELDNLMEWQDSLGTVLSMVNSYGDFAIGTNDAEATLHVAGDTLIETQVYLLSEFQSFESATFPPDGWGTTGYANWSRVTSDYQEGTASAKSGSLSHSQYSEISKEVYIPYTGQLKFYWKVSSDSTDYLLFCVNTISYDCLGDAEAQISGTVGWTEYTYTINSPGYYTFRWQYSKDGSVSAGSDAGWVDNIRFLSRGSMSAFNVADIDRSSVLGVDTSARQVLIGGSFVGGSDAESRGENNFVFGDKVGGGGILDETFATYKSAFNGTVYSTLIQSDGKILMAGNFSIFDVVPRARIARLNTDGTLDTTFLAAGVGANGDVKSIALQSDGKIIIGGSFTTYNSTARGYVARLNSDGSLDTTFLNTGAGANNTVETIALQSDGKVIIGGNFTTYNGTSRGYLARLNTDGSLDTTFLNTGAGANSTLYNLIVQAADGKVIVGGAFTTYNGTSRGRIARLNTDGSLDTTFLNTGAGANSTLYNLVVQADEKVIIGGNFTTYNGTSRGRIARLNTDGSLDTTFLNTGAGASTNVYSIYAQPDGKILIGGGFTTYNGTSRLRIARLNIDGSLDTTFQNNMTGSSGNVYSVFLQSNYKILISGSFNTVNGVFRGYSARLNTDGSVDTTFLQTVAGSNGTISCMLSQPDGKILVGGSFTYYGGVPRNYIARLNPDGSLDTTFLDTGTGANTNVETIALQSDGKIVIGGSFTMYNSTARAYVARLNSDGSLDTTFLNTGVGANSTVRTVALQPDGKIVIGGSFTMYNSTARGYVARLNSDGSLDTTFLNTGTGASSEVYRIVVQSDGKVIVGGNFTTYNGTSRGRIARLSTDGSLDTTFLNTGAGANSNVVSITFQPNGKILIGGDFSTYNVTSRARVARLNSDGSLDTTFLNTGTGANGTIQSIKYQRDGKIIIVGTFTTYGGVARFRFACLNSDGSLDNSFVLPLNLDSVVYDILIQEDLDKLILVGAFVQYGNESVGRILRVSTPGTTMFNNVARTFLVGFGNSRFNIDSDSATLTGAKFGIGTESPEAMLSVIGDNNNSDLFKFQSYFGNELLTLNSVGTLSAAGDVAIGPSGSLKLGSSGIVRYNEALDALEFSNDNLTWMRLASAQTSTVLSAEYAGAVFSADGSANVGSMTADSEGTASNSMNYYEWNSSETTLNDYDVRVRFQLPANFERWGSGGVTFNLATEATGTTNNKVSFYVYKDNSATVDGSSVDQTSSSAGVWKTTNVSGVTLDECDTAGETCMFIIKMFSGNDSYSRVGDIVITYDRKL